MDTGEISRSFEEKDDIVSDKPAGSEKKKVSGKDLIFYVHEIFQHDRQQKFEISHFCWTRAL